MDIIQNIQRLLKYALNQAIIEKEDVIYSQNRLMELFRIKNFNSSSDITLLEVHSEDLEEILKEMLDYAYENNLIEENSVTYRDLFDTKIMGLLIPPPSVIIKKFYDLKKNDCKKATDWYYKFCGDTDYIRRYRLAKDLKWKTATEYGNLDITINLSKPEKDPKSIAKAGNIKEEGYPACSLCKENEGFEGDVQHAARQNLRIIPLKLNEEDWFLQYSPYGYFNEHCIVFDSKHVPMKISRETFVRLLDFIVQFPHYTIGSNADIPIVGGSILSHNHFQGGKYVFPMAKAAVETSFALKAFPHVKAGIVKWPLSVIRLDAKNREELTDACAYILNVWKDYTDESAFIYAATAGGKHNTITPIARMNASCYEMDLVLRNNITSAEHPLGVFHPHAELHHIKKENIGLIEVMGLAVLPGRLKQELAELAEAICKHKDLSVDEKLSKHAFWAADILRRNPSFNYKNADGILKEETGFVFKQVLEDAGVFKRTETGKEAFQRFIDSCGGFHTPPLGSK